MDELEIKALLVRERYYRDSRQWEKLRNSYHPDASLTKLDISWFRGNIDDFVSGSKQMAQGGTNAFHSITPVEVSINGTKALSLSIGNITIRFEKDGSMYDCISWTRFISRLERIDQGWKMLTLDAIYERDSILPVVPGTIPANPFKLDVPRQSYQCLGWLLAQRGYSINPNLPGLDWPESVQSFLDEQSRWLQE